MPDLTALLRAWTRELAQALEMMTGESFNVSQATPLSDPASGLLWWTQQFTQPNGGLIAAGAEPHVWLEVGTRVLQGAGVDLVDAAEARGTWFELLQQATGGAVRAVTTSGAKLETGTAGEGTEPSGTYERFEIKITAPNGSELALVVALSPDLLKVAKTEHPAAGAATSTAMITAAAGSPFGSGIGLGPVAARTMDALLDVELQVSISFGQTVLPLKDVLKLTTGTVVELNRLPEEPVDVIVNDCIVARGEVVVVEGNYAVRIQDIMSRQQRLGLSDRSHLTRGEA